MILVTYFWTKSPMRANATSDFANEERKMNIRNGVPTHRIATVFAALLFMLGCNLAQAVVLSDDRRIAVKLDDGTDVVLYGEAGRSRDIGYYYLPPRLTVAISDDDRPEFL